MTQLICGIYRSTLKEGMYLYVEKQKQLALVPEALLTLFGKPEYAMTLLITPEKKLAHADAKKVMTAIETEGYYLQMPPKIHSYMEAVHLQNSKMPS